MFASGRDFSGSNFGGTSSDCNVAYGKPFETETGNKPVTCKS
jgi:hypothetical protein